MPDDVSMDQVMASLRLIAETCMATSPIKDIVTVNALTESMWLDYVAICPTLNALRPRSVAYQVIRGMWLIAYGSADLLPVETIHLAYTLPHQLLTKTLTATTLSELQLIFGYPGGIEALVTRITKHVLPAQALMWGEAEGDIVHLLLAKFLKLDPAKANFYEQIEAWSEEVRATLADPAASALQSIATMLLHHYQGSSAPTPDTRMLDFVAMVRLYDVIRNSFYAVLQQGERRPVTEIVQITIPLLVALAEVRENIALFGMLEQESILFANLDMTAKAKAMTYLKDERIKAILRELGRMLSLGTGVASVDMVKTEDYTTSGRIEDLNVNGMLTLATNPEEFYARYATNNLQTYDRDTDRKQQAPFIIIQDVSGSMKDQKDIWSRAIALRLAEQAFREHRSFAMIVFARAQNSLRCVVIHPPAGANELMELIQIVPNGGTDYDLGLRQAVAVVEQHRLTGAAMLLMTDGEAVLSSDFHREFRLKKRDLGFELHGLLINLGGATVSAGSLRSFCDSVRLASDLTDALAEEILTLV